MGLTGKISIFKLVSLLGLLLFSIYILPAHSDTVNYIYDNLGRLAMAVSTNGDVVIYQWDEAGNPLSVTHTTVSNQSSMLTGIIPSQVFIGREIQITITGNNLPGTKSVTTSNPGIQIKSFAATNNSVSIDAVISANASPGPASFTVWTVTGSASISMNLLSLTFAPAQIAMVNGTSTSVTARIAGLSSDYNLTLNNQNPDLINAPQSLTVPVSGSASFIVNAVSPGSGSITAGNSGLPVYIGTAYTGIISLLSKAVSVEVQPTISALSNSLPVSVKVAVVPIQAVSPPVSVALPQHLITM